LYGTFELEHQQEGLFNQQLSVTGKRPNLAIF